MRLVFVSVLGSLFNGLSLVSDRLIFLLIISTTKKVQLLLLYPVEYKTPFVFLFFFYEAKLLFKWLKTVSEAANCSKMIKIADEMIAVPFKSKLNVLKILFIVS